MVSDLKVLIYLKNKFWGFIHEMKRIAANKMNRKVQNNWQDQRK